MKINLIWCTPKYKDVLYLAGRNCYGLEKLKKETENNKSLFIQKCITNQHLSVIEHAIISIYSRNVSRSFMAQITRHRLVSFSVKSQHYCNYEDFLYKQLENVKSKQLNIEYNNLMKKTNNFYKKLVLKGVPKYIAREILPNSCLTNIFMTANAREWRHIIELRIIKNNTPEIIEWSKKVLIILNKIMPDLFFDLYKKYINPKFNLY